jgi:hypothetical protein
MACVARHGSGFAQADELVRNRRSETADEEVADFKPFFFFVSLLKTLFLYYS